MVELLYRKALVPPLGLPARLEAQEARSSVFLFDICEITIVIFYFFPLLSFSLGS